MYFELRKKICVLIILKMTLQNPFGIFKDRRIYLDKLLLILLLIQILCPISVNGLEDRQVFLRSELPDGFSFHQKQTFKVLQLNSLCSHYALESCHSGQDKYNAFRDRCFTDVCPREQYFCLDFRNIHTIHICGIPFPWMKRRRSIVVLETHSSVSADVYVIDCPVGYIHNNEKDPFNLCIKDVTIVVVRGATDVSPAIGRCRSEKRYRYCNAKDVTFFNLGSDQDVCLDEYDHRQKCSETTELMPNCSCVPKCQDGVDRDWNQTFLCKQADETMISTKKSIEDVTFKPKTTSSQESVSVGTEGDEDLSVKDGKDINDHNTGTLVVTVMVIGSVIAVSAVVAVVMFSIKFFKQHVPYRHVKIIVNQLWYSQCFFAVANQYNVPGRTNDDQSRHSSEKNSGKNEKRDPKSRDALVKVPESCLEDISDNNPLLEMEKLKECDNGSADSGMYTGDETARKLVA